MVQLGREDVAAAVATAQAEIRYGAKTGASVQHLLRRLAERMDALIQGLLGADLLPQTRLSIVALGGYARMDLFPFSDLDLLILHDEQEKTAIDAVVGRVIYPLWDAQLSVGHAARTVAETLQLAEEDVTLATALLDARHIAGEPEVFGALLAEVRTRLFARERINHFSEQLIAGRRARHERFGESVYLLEPNVKSGKGGLRDIAIALWAAKARFGIRDLDDLARVGAATERQAAALIDAREFLHGLRLAMHLDAGRSQDQLLFEQQERLAPALFPDPVVMGKKRQETPIAPPIERLMHTFYRHARKVVLESEGILDRCQVALMAQPQARRAVAEGYETDGVYLYGCDVDLFWRRPAELLRIFKLALEQRLTVARATRDAIAEAVAGDPGAQLVADEEAAMLWLALLCYPEPTGGTVLQALHDVGLISAMIPEFERCTGLVRHDLYHVYTVDQHSLYVVRLLKALRWGDQTEKYPTAVAVSAELTALESLLLAGLIHDIGKALGRGHAEKGARLAQGIAARLGLSPAQQAEVTFLVRHHLTMAHISQRRDLADPQVVVDFAKVVGHVENLRRLYLLSIADTAMTAPGNLSQWKLSLLDNLYLRTFQHLTSGVSVHDRQASLLSVRREELAQQLGRIWGRRGAETVARLPDALVASFSVDDLVHHVGVALDLEINVPDAPGRIGTRSSGVSTTELTVCCGDAPGVLALLNAVMIAHRIDVVAAKVYTLLGDHGGPPRVLDVFWVTGISASDYGTWHAFTESLAQTLSGQLAVEQLVAPHLRPSALATRLTPRIDTTVGLNNAASERFSVLEVTTALRPGLFYLMTKNLTAMGIDIHLAIVNSEAQRGIAVFYLLQDGQKIEASAAQAAMQAQLVAVLDQRSG